MEVVDTGNWIQYVLSGIGVILSGLIGWLVTYERRMTKTESKIDVHQGDIRVLYEKDSSTNKKLDTKLDGLETKFEQGLNGVRDDIKDLIRAVAKAP